MIIVKILISIVLIINLSCNRNKMEKQNFKVFGEKSLLKDCKINIATYKQIGYDTVASKPIASEEFKTLLFNGDTYSVESQADDALYITYISYKDSLLCAFKYENIMGGEKSQINHFYIQKNEDMITFKFVGNETFLKEINNRPINVLIPVDEYFIENRITDKDLISREKKLFFDRYVK